MIEGKDIVFSYDNPTIELGAMFGILIDKNGKASVANEIFELRISNYLASKISADSAIRNMTIKEDIVQGGKLDMALCLEKFADHYYELFNKRDAAFLESHGRILFITYLKPLINGQGFYHIEPQTRNTRRMDLVVDFGPQQFVVELKLWHGEKRHEDSYSQIWDYLDGKGLGEGYLLTFDFRRESMERRVPTEYTEHRERREPAEYTERTECTELIKDNERKPAWIEFKGKRIFDIII